MNEEQNMQSQITTNQDSVGNNFFMLERVNTDKPLNKIEKYLSGRRKYLVRDANGRYTEREEQFANPRANKQGINEIMQIITNTINPQTVQGNLKIDHYWEHVAEMREDLAIEIVCNRVAWDIREEDTNNIINNIMRVVELFLTRTLDNKERDSYDKTVNSREVYTNEKKRNMQL